VVITRRLSLAKYEYTQPCSKIVVAGVIDRMGDDKRWHHGWSPMMSTVALV
jgi:hypothetical protein